MNKQKKFVIGGGISGLIFAFYNKDYSLISPDIGGKLKYNYLASTILLHDSIETRSLISDLKLILEPKSHIIRYFFNNELQSGIPVHLREMMVAKKLTLWNDLRSLNFQTASNDSTLSTEDIFIPVYKTSTFKLTKLLSKEIRSIKDKVIRITQDEIITERERFEYDEIVSTIPAPVFWEIYGENKKLKSIPGTFVLSSTPPLKGESLYWDLIYFVDREKLYTRVNKYNNSYFLYEFTGKITGDQIRKNIPDLDVSHVYTDNYAIIKTNLNNIPPPKIRFIGRFATWNHRYKIQDVIKDATTKYDFMSVWNKQKEFNANFFDFNVKNIELQQKLTKDFILHLEDESHELLQEINWKMNLYKRIPVDRQKVLEEWIDIFKFWLGIGNIWGITPDEFFNNFWRKSEIVDKKYKEYFLNKFSL